MKRNRGTMNQSGDLQSRYLNFSKQLFGQKNSAKFALITLGVGVALLVLFLDAWQAGAFFIGVGLFWIVYISINLSRTQKKLTEIEQSAKAQEVHLLAFDPKTLAAPPSQTDKPLAATKRHKGNTLAIIGGVLLIAGAFLPWGSISSMFGTISRSGIEGDGIFIMAFGIIALVIALVHLGKQKRMYSWVLILLGVLSFMIIFSVDMKMVQLSMENTSSVEIRTGSGPTVIYLGSIITSIAGIVKVPAEL